VAGYNISHRMIIEEYLELILDNDDIINFCDFSISYSDAAVVF
jgi:hypothetical protein